MQSTYSFQLDAFTTTATTTTATNTAAWTAMPYAPQSLLCDQPRKPTLIERLKAKAKAGTLGPADFPAIAGAAPKADVADVEVEIERDRKTKLVKGKEELVSDKKKAIVKTKAVTRDKGDGIGNFHDGTLELVRTQDAEPGMGHTLDTVGIKATPGTGSYVEINVAELRRILNELEPTI